MKSIIQKLLFVTFTTMIISSLFSQGVAASELRTVDSEISSVENSSPFQAALKAFEGGSNLSVANAGYWEGFAVQWWGGIQPLLQFALIPVDAEPVLGQPFFSGFYFYRDNLLPARDFRLVTWNDVLRVFASAEITSANEPYVLQKPSGGTIEMRSFRGMLVGVVRPDPKTGTCYDKTQPPKDLNVCTALYYNRRVIQPK